jgi:putative solute:sodium symporter small subunit
MPDANETLWWRRTASLAAGVIAGFTVLAVAPLAFVRQLDAGNLFGLPAGYLLASLVGPVVVVLAIFWFAEQQRALDHRHDLSDD